MSHPPTIVRCGRCSTVAPPGARFCPSCGAPLTTRAAAPTRKWVTAVFCDGVSSTQLGDAVDPEPLRAVMTRYFDSMRTTLERHGGSVEKFIGDAVVGVFGVPVTHEDDPTRAVRAAAEMRAALNVLNEE